MAAQKTSLFEHFITICNTLFHQLVGIVTVFILWTLFYNLQMNSTYTWHTILTAAAYMPLMAEAIVLFANENVWTSNINRTTKYKIHAAFLVLSAIFATSGISCMINRKVTSNSVHFTSIHAITGLVSWILVLLSQFLGVCSFHSQSLKNVMKPVYFKFIHNFLGMAGFVLGVVSLGYGLQKHTFLDTTSYEARTASAVILGVITFWTCLAALKSGFNQLKTIVSS